MGSIWRNRRRGRPGGDDGAQARDSRPLEPYHPGEGRSRGISFEEPGQGSKPEPIENAEVRIISCRKCGSRNRVRIHRQDIIPLCGKCHAGLEDALAPADLLKDINDALTGEQIDPGKEVYQCRKCRVYYHGSSLEILKEMNYGNCVSCGSKSMAKVESLKEHKRGVNARPSAITIDNYRDFIGRVVTFEGYVPKVEISGKSYSVMFENKPWREGLKMLVLRQYVDLLGGADFLRGLQGKILRVKGLLTRHPEYGDEILVVDRTMILDIR